jgi:ABC-type transporter Mla maintaining outer membrane lipid asymmetry ATPase subunit MlaF
MKFLMLNDGGIRFHGATGELVHSKDPWIVNYLA